MAYKFSSETQKKFEWLITRYPKKDAALLPILHMVQGEVGYLSVEAIDFVADQVGVSSARVKEVASFYTMFKFQPQGKFVLQVCHNISCYLKGSDTLIDHLRESLGLQNGDKTADGLFEIERVECLASCGTAPVMQVNNWEFHENLDVEKLQKIIDALRQGRWAKKSFDERKQDGSVA